MILVAGATGLLGAEVCNILRGRGIPVRALARQAANPARLEQLRKLGVEFAWGDLKDPATLHHACDGVDTVISTASSTISRQAGDGIETVDRLGQLALIEAAKQAHAGHFTFVSIPRKPLYDSPLTRAKAEVEQRLAESGVPYTILAANYFMEVWLSPALGFDYVNRKAAIFGTGRSRMSWISYRDVAQFATHSHAAPGARNRILEIGGPDDLSPLEVVAIFEQAAGAPFECQFVPEEALVAQLQTAADPMAETFLKLQLEYTRGSTCDSAEALSLMPIGRMPVRQYAESVIRKAATA